MAVRIPLVIVNGQIQQLQSGDSIADHGQIKQMTNSNAGAIVIGSVVYADGADTVDLAQADAEGTSQVIGLVQEPTQIGIAGTGGIITGGVMTATTGEWDAVSDLTGGLDVDDLYYLDETTPGAFTATAPSATSEYVVPIGIGLSTTDMLLLNHHRILL